MGDYTGAVAVQAFIATLKNARSRLQRDLGLSQTDRSAAMRAGRVSQLAMGSVELVEKNDEEEEKRQANLRRAEDQLNKSLEEHVYSAAAAVQESVAVLISAEPRSKRHRGRSEADWYAGTDPGLGLSSTSLIVASATSASDATAKRVGGEERGRRRAGLLYAQEQLKKCLQDISAELGDTDAGRGHSVTDLSQGALSSIEYLVGGAPLACSRVRLEGLTFLSIGKVSRPQPTDKWNGHGKEHGKVGKGRKGSGKIEAGFPQVQSVYFGGDAGEVICTLATGEDVKRIPGTLSPERLC